MTGGGGQSSSNRSYKLRQKHKGPTAVEAELLERLRQFDAPTISNAIELFEVRPRSSGYMDGRIRCAFPEMPAVVGFAVTAQFRASSAAPSGQGYGALETVWEAIERRGAPTIVVCEDLDDPPMAATFGEVMCGAYKALGAAALITSGAGRDLASVRTLGFPVFQSAIICSHAYCHMVDAGQEVSVGGLRVRSGDLMHADANGVTSVPLEIAAEVPEAATEFLRCERLVTDYLATDGPKSAAELLERRRAMGDAIAELRRRVSRRAAASAS